MDLSQLSLSVTLDESVRDELDALAAIYEQPDSLSLDKQTGDERDRVLRLDTRLPEPYSDVPLSLLLALPNTYPSSSPPRIEISSKYLGAYAADDSLRLFVSCHFSTSCSV